VQIAAAGHRLWFPASRCGVVMSVACIAFDTGSCPRMAVDVPLFFDYFRVNGWTLADDVEDADLIVVSTCGVTREAKPPGLPPSRASKPSADLVRGWW